MGVNKTLNLTDKQIFFCKEYIVDFNGTQAAIRAGYSEDSAKQIASENLTKPDIQGYIEELKEIRSKRVDVSADKIVIELAKIAFSDVRKIFGPDGQLLPISQIDDESAGAIASIKSYEERLTTSDVDAEQITQGTNREIKLHDKIKALELLGKHIGFFEKDNSQQAKALIAAMPLKIEIVQPQV